MASRRITQETFDSVVQENITEFQMEPEEALNEAIQQFESQGVDLINIVKAVQNTTTEASDQKHIVLQALDELRRALDLMALDEMGDHLTNFSEQCSLDFAHRHLAAEKSAYPTVLSSCRQLMSNAPYLLKGIQALANLLDGQPDLLDPEGQQLLLEILKQHRDHAALNTVTICAIRHSCLKHEQNRQDLVQLGVLALLTGAIVNHGNQADVVREAGRALRVMTYDDDIRVPFGRAHDHAKLIVMENDGLRILIEAAKAFTDNPSVLSELCSTLSRLAVRNEFCQDIVDLGGLNFMVALLADCIEHREVVKQVLGALRAIAGNDEVKDAIINAGGTDLIVLAMNRHLGTPQICEQGCAALGMFALRKPENCRVIMEGGGALIALQAMKAHPAEVNVQKQACMLLRNLVARNPDFSQLILEMGAEVLILQAKTTHQDCEDLAKAALRDLGCKVELQEFWTGQKAEISR
ncbi:armadillo repeat-containing protein 6 isoform X1 [Rhincodon typus]|uniref:armadillo repeat-containing protein 6 isoform X1 n=1 Tax=Rhincodon typus TaxID=259920 RepID=UPI0009A2D9B1|nr:armadillo repeat-containing protein 6 isoform X1 [Rhincodon typus]XP_048469956.1 armadillo repeat-containing protein 6 isoform X1 [Rhincodon typus]